MKRLLISQNLSKKRLVANFIFSFFLLLPLNDLIFINKVLSTTSDNSVEDIDNDYLTKNYYILGPGDTIFLKIFDMDDLSGPITILNDGNLISPFGDLISAEGLTINQLKEKLKLAFSKQLISPELVIYLKEAKPLKISIIGQVMRPGLYSLNSNLFNPDEKNQKGLPTIIDAIQKSGGISENANLKDVKVKRKIPGSNDLYKTANINLYSMIMNGDQKQNLYLFDGDIIEIRKGNSELNELTSIYSSNLSPEEIDVFIVGEVVSPGKVTLPSNTALSQAILAAGGPTNWRTNKGNVELVRLNSDGTINFEKFKIDFSRRPSKQNNPILRNGDSIRVRKNSAAKLDDSLSRVSSPVSKVVDILTLFKLLNDG